MEKILDENSGKTLYMCTQCNLLSNHKSAIYRHIRNLHKKLWFILCPMCSAPFLRTEYMEDHHRKKHPNNSLDNITEILWRHRDGGEFIKPYKRRATNAPTPPSQPSPFDNGSTPDWDSVDNLTKLINTESRWTYNT